MKSLGKTILVLLFLWMAILAACHGDPVVDSDPGTETPVPTASATPTETPTPSATPLPPVGLLLAPPEADAGLVEEVQAVIAEGIRAKGYRFQVRPSLSAGDFERDDFQLVVALPPNPGIAELAGSQPRTRFLAVGFQGLDSASNLSVIGTDEDHLDQQGFVAGYMAALITPDWRTGVIGLSDTDQTTAARKAFMTGVQFYCGLCLPVYPPFFEYPLWFELGSGATTEEWRAAADFMIHRTVETVYVVPGAGDEAMLRHLAQSGVNIIGGTVPPADLQAQWVASLRFDHFQAFVDYWPEFLEGAAGGPVQVPLALTDVNPALLSPGRQRLVEQVLSDVTAGYYDLGIEGEEAP